jgi:hypothetical protein
MSNPAQAELTHSQPTITLRLSIPAAYWLMALTQNYMPGPGVLPMPMEHMDPAVVLGHEDLSERELRHAIFLALQLCLEDYTSGSEPASTPRPSFP